MFCACFLFAYRVHRKQEWESTGFWRVLDLVRRQQFLNWPAAAAIVFLPHYENFGGKSILRSPALNPGLSVVRRHQRHHRPDRFPAGKNSGKIRLFIFKKQASYSPAAGL
jgi:hypothetical protein